MLPLAPLEGRKGEDSVTFGENEESLEQGSGKEGDWTKAELWKGEEQRLFVLMVCHLISN